MENMSSRPLAPHGSPSLALESTGAGGGSAAAEMIVVSLPEATGAAARPPRPTGALEHLQVSSGSGNTPRDFAMVVAGEAHSHNPLHYQLPVATMDDTTGAPDYPLKLVQSPPVSAADAGCCIRSPAVGALRSLAVAPEQQYAKDMWLGVGGFTPIGNENIGASTWGGQPQSQQVAMAKHLPSQSNCWACAPHYNHNSFCAKHLKKLGLLLGRRQVAATANTAMPDYSAVNLPAAMAIKEQDRFLVWEGKRERRLEGEKKEVREIEFFPPSKRHGSYSQESEFVVAASSSSSGSAMAPLDLSLKL